MRSASRTKEYIQKYTRLNYVDSLGNQCLIRTLPVLNGMSIPPRHQPFLDYAIHLFSVPQHQIHRTRVKKTGRVLKVKLVIA